MPEKLDTSELKNAINVLNDDIDAYTKCSSENHTLKTIRSQIIQDFEIAYKMSWKFMKRWLEINISPDVVLGISIKELYKIAKEHQLITDFKKWWKFHEANNRITPTYDENIAEGMIEIAMEFSSYALELISSLEELI
ncbi:nucleotidyltransferase substrate binding protein [Methanobrevibacter filiformis]|uniref:Nucleotidyltransferase substrate binding protein like protein n=1 Tax=Methanobrevibacter filiformis TaxID=55758 RepID=A0A166FIB4_9EURY|nr:nucleotidyltransferase substrate binding protein [Methanobrevibacter filiformis]KZX17702.1 nucleotidyltransferase substrate binding protein like protein [Methanobrevibacter filiformis]